MDQRIIIPTMRATKYNEELPPNIPHNEAILIPNHYSMRATSSNEYTTVECDDVKKKLLSREKNISVSMEEYTSHVSITQYDSGMKRNLGKDRIILKPPPPPFRSELSVLNNDIHHKIDTDRESQIAWSEEDSVHTDWSESNIWSDEEDDCIFKGK